MTAIDLDDFCRQMDCNYDGERYSVRDNGAVLRQTREGKRPRATDGQWTFGKPNEKNGYMYIASVRVHRIVATAFHGVPPTPEHVVDHIDTNRRNNRPDNLRWLTKLENALLNPITVKRIEFICGSIEAFLDDPSRLRHSTLDRNIEWMRTVSPQEAQACRERMHLWAKTNNPSSGGSLGEWVFKPNTAQTQSPEAVTASPQVAQAIQEHMHLLAKSDEPLFGGRIQEVESKQLSFRRQATRTFYEPPPALVMATTPGAAQRNWRVPSEFPCCPQEAGEEPIAAYAQRLKEGASFARNHLTASAVLEVVMADDRQTLWVMCENCEESPVKPWSLAQVTFEDGLFVHTSRGTFFDKLGAEKRFCLAQGLEWTGGDSIDDYC